jgi:hypothetical protein
MGRVRVSTTVDEKLLGDARQAHPGLPDAALIDKALATLVAASRAAELDAAYAAYDRTPLDTPDEWGDLASWGAAACAS